MRKVGKILTLSVMMSCWLLSTKCSASTGEVTKVDGGYLFPEAALRDTVAGWRADHASVAVLQSGMDELKAEIDSQNEKMNTQIADLEKEISKERRENKLQLKRAKVNYFLIGAIIGGIVGAIAANK